MTREGNVNLGYFKIKNGYRGWRMTQEWLQALRLKGLKVQWGYWKNEV